MSQRKNLPTKPGGEKSAGKPDAIKSLTVMLPSDKESIGLMEFLIQELPDIKRTNIKELLKYGQVMTGGAQVSQFDIQLSHGDEVLVNFTRPFQTFSHPRLKIVYEDDDIIVVNKGYGLLSVGSERIKSNIPTAYSLLYDYLKRKNPANKIFVVHRLDQHTSGLMMFAKKIEAKEKMQHNWNNMVLDRRYVAVTEGAPEPEEGKIESWLAENSQHVVYSTERNVPGAKQAVTYYKTMGKRGQYALVELSLATGRKNQIRVHMAENGHPIAGDRKYGAKTAPIGRLALHARTLRFIHPTTRKDMNFNAPIPDSFRRLV